MNQPAYDQLRELSWRRALTAEEEASLQAHLANHPEARAEWEDDDALNRALERLPAAPPVSSNFTALVVKRAEHEANVESLADSIRNLVTWLYRLRWVPRVAFALLVVGITFGVYQHHQTKAREAMVRSVIQVSEAISAPTPAAAEDFDAIRLVGQSEPKADTELLLALMQ